MPTSELLSKLGWSSLKEKRNKQKALMMFKIMNGMTPAYLEDNFSRNIGRSVYNFRISRRNLALQAVKTNYYRNSFAYTGPAERIFKWGGLNPTDATDECNPDIFSPIL